MLRFCISPSGFSVSVNPLWFSVCVSVNFRCRVLSDLVLVRVSVRVRVMR